MLAISKSPIHSAEHFHRDCQDNFLGDGIIFPSLFHQADFIHGANLIQDDLPLFSFKLAVNPSWVISSFGGHWGNDYGVNMIIHFVR